MPVFDYVQQYGTLLCVERDEEEVIKYKQLTALDFLEFGFKAVSDFRHLQGAEKFCCIAVQGAYAALAGLMSQCARQEALAGSCRTCDEEICTLAHEVESGEPFHLVAVEPPADGVVDFFHIGFVAE